VVARPTCLVKRFSTTSEVVAVLEGLGSMHLDTISQCVFTTCIRDAL
jgi:hypothetical protein